MSYNIEKCDTSKTTFSSAGTTDNLTFKVKRLFEGSEYKFRVAAENKIGFGEYAESGEVKCKLPFGKSYIIVFVYCNFRFS